MTKIILLCLSLKPRIKKCGKIKKKINHKDISKSSQLPKISFVVKSKNENWKFHKNDVDPSPSTPHGHFKDKKLNPYTGEVFGVKNKKLLEIIGKKQLIAILKALINNKDFAQYREQLKNALNELTGQSIVENVASIKQKQR